ncbi:MAG: substrate-binding domain-containing protein [Desulfuromonadaceae bacterium]|nr:substrate-binding domain-containing protein [Desulfuromonadaceae bacterium]
MSRIVLITGVLLSLFCTSVAGADEVKIATGVTFIKRVFDPVKNPFRDKTGIDITILFNDPIPALAELEKGNADVAGASLPLAEWLNQARSAGIPVQEIGRYTSYVPVTEKAMIVVNAGNRVNALSKEQLKGIFTGKTQNWQEVGGDDAPILVIWPSVSSGALILFKARIMDNEALTKTVYDVESVGDTPDAIAATPEAIGIVTGTTAAPGLKEIAPAIERPLTLVYKGPPTPTLQKLLDFLKNEGKMYIK